MEQTHVLKLDGKGNIQMFDKSWNLLETIGSGTKIPLLSNGKNKVIADAEFVTDGFSKLNIEMKTISQPNS
jgi:hypothetical protein